MSTKKIMLGVKVDAELKDKVKEVATAQGKDVSDYVRDVLTAAVGESPAEKKDPIRAALAEAMVVILACQGRSVSTEQAITLVKDLFITGAFQKEVA
jgi:antitoxin component of RelBE/YafQ-DinJ toxin-antitoxin module